MKMQIKNIEYLDKSMGEGFITLCSEKIIIEMLIDKDNNMGIINDLEVCIDGYLPGDSKNGDHIMFNATRIDLDENYMEDKNY